MAQSAPDLRLEQRLSHEPLEDQVSSDISDIVQISKTDLMTRGVAVDLLQVANGVGTQCEATEYEDLPGEENLPLDCIVLDLTEPSNLLVKTRRNSQ